MISGLYIEFSAYLYYICQLNYLTAENTIYRWKKFMVTFFSGTFKNEIYYVPSEKMNFGL